MKAILLSVIVLSLVLGAPSVYALTDTGQKVGIASDKVGRPCTFGLNHDECHDQFFERIHNLPTLPSNQYYGACIETEPDNELRCDILTVSIQSG